MIMLVRQDALVPRIGVRTAPPLHSVFANPRRTSDFLQRSLAFFRLAAQVKERRLSSDRFFQ